jgi:hypothetical protein
VPIRPIQRREAPRATIIGPRRAAQQATWDEAVEEFIATQEQRLRGKRTLDNHRWVLMGRLHLDSAHPLPEPAAVPALLQRA